MAEQPRNRKIGNYQLGRTLGKGTFGKVKMGIHQQSGEKVAIKILEKDRIIETADVERVQREIHILNLVRHPHIIQLYEIIETPKHIFLVTEMVDGGELFEYIVNHTKLEEIEACKFFQELISGIEYLHKIKVVHRDLKPENLLLDTNRNIKIVDFGLSNTYKEGEQLKTACGSPCYAAPEMIQGQKYVALKVDLWSCGVILFASMCGYLPFEDQNTSALYKKILSGSYKFPDHLSREAKDMIQSILTVDPDKRFGIAEIRNHSWFKLYRRSYEIPPGIVVGYNRIPIDQDILNQMATLHQIPLDYAQKCLDANKHNNVTTLYHLLLKRHLLDGGQSTADLNSEAFDISLLEPKPRPNKRININQLAPINSAVNNDIIRQQVKNEVLKQRSFSTDKDRGRTLKHHLINENDSSLNRVTTGQQHHSVQARIEQQHVQQASPIPPKKKSYYVRQIFPNNLLKQQNKAKIVTSIDHGRLSKSKRDAVETSIGQNRSVNHRQLEQQVQRNLRKGKLQNLSFDVNAGGVYSSKSKRIEHHGEFYNEIF